MITELMTFIDELKEIKKSLDFDNKDNTIDLIDTAVNKYQGEVDAFDKWADEESKKDLEINNLQNMNSPETQGELF
tara:strand:- start:488 stop:715 length:228 start_codon:yes stop_codon:yes gene_type:complete